nr:hypothetical protein [Tanacetum cinerariifolium]
MSIQLARDLEAEFAQEDLIIREQAKRDSEIARIHAEKELEIMIVELDRSNEMVAKYLSQKKYWKIIRVGNHTEVYQLFEDMLKKFHREDLDKLWSLVKETCSIIEVIDEKEKELWVDLKRLYDPDSRDPLWALKQCFYPAKYIMISNYK